jgi:hypothetical protein
MARAPSKVWDVAAAAMEVTGVGGIFVLSEYFVHSVLSLAYMEQNKLRRVAILLMYTLRHFFFNTSCTPCYPYPYDSHHEEEIWTSNTICGDP